MASTISWLDSSPDEQRRVREIIGLFAQSESRDELGIGQIRDVFSDLLFPGTSVIQTRARYFLFVPWHFVEAARRGHHGTNLANQVERQERRLVETLKADGHVDGLIGRLVGGPSLKILPSTIYWSGLERFGILRQSGSVAEIARRFIATTDAETEELAERAPSTWHPTLPSPPDGFPGTVTRGFALTAEEAEWLSDRMVASAGGSMLEHLLIAESLPDLELIVEPWDPAVAESAPTELQEVLDQARRFSVVMHGAALLYNLLVAEAYADAGHTTHAGATETYRAELDAWAAELSWNVSDLNREKAAALWATVLPHNPRISIATRNFIDGWTDVIRDSSGVGIADDRRARSLLAQRERRLKGAQSRLTNLRLLGAWSGRSGTSRLVFRWPTAKRMVIDIRSGLDEGWAV